MAKTDYITSGNFRLMVYQSDIINGSSSDPYVQVSVYLQAYSTYSGKALNFLGVNAWSATLLGNTYTASGGEEHLGSSTWSGWKTIKTVFSQKGIWSVSKTRTSFNATFSSSAFYVDGVGYVNISLSGTVSMAAWPASGTKDTASIASSMTMGSSYTITITHRTSGNKNTLTYSFGGATGTILSNSTATSVSFTPPTSLGAKIPSASSGTISFTLTTYNSSGASLGSTSYSSKLSVPSYSLSAPTVSAAKNTYTSVGAYVANKTKTRFTLSGLPSGSYGATVTGTYVINLGSTQQTSGSKTGTSASNVDYTASAAGTLTLTYTVKDSRGKTASKSASVTYVANQTPTISFSAARDDTTPTNWSGTATGTYLDVSGNTATITFSAGTAGTATVGSGAFSSPVSGTLAETDSLSVKATVTDSLGNTTSITKTIATVFAYIEATPNRVISIGRKASTNITDKLQIGLPTAIEGDIDQLNGGELRQYDTNATLRASLDFDGLTFFDSSGTNISTYDASYQEAGEMHSIGTSWTEALTINVEPGLYAVCAGLAYSNSQPRGVAIVGVTYGGTMDYNLAQNENYASVSGRTVSWLWCGATVRITGNNNWDLKMYAKSANAGNNRVYMFAKRLG